MKNSQDSVSDGGEKESLASGLRKRWHTPTVIVSEAKAGTGKTFNNTEYNLLGVTPVGPS